jgi:DDE superfamily endonuclease
MKNQWLSYHKWLEKGKWSYLKIMKRWTQLFLQLFPDKQVYLAIDDSIVLRHSKKAPESKIYHQHGCKTNLSQFVRGQCWVALAAVVDRAGSNTALPLLFRLTPEVGNSSKLTTVRTLIREVIHQFKQRAVTVLVDSWYMRYSFIVPIQKYGLNVIGQVRIDTVFCKRPKQHKDRG